MVRVGTDIVEVDRVRRAVERTGEAFIRRVYTEGEAAYCDAGAARRFESYAARFAAKEAFAKATGEGVGANVHLNEVEVVNLDHGKPVLRLHGTTAAFFEEAFPGASVDVSLSHTSKLAVATVVIGTAEE